MHRIFDTEAYQCNRLVKGNADLYIDSHCLALSQ